jgi:hypothetical protein
MKNLMIPLALALAVSASGAALAATSGNSHADRYGQANASAQSMNTASAQSAAATPDPRLDPESQRASMARQESYMTMPADNHSGWVDPWADGIYGPSGPE